MRSRAREGVRRGLEPGRVDRDSLTLAAIAQRLFHAVGGRFVSCQRRAALTDSRGNFVRLLDEVSMSDRLDGAHGRGNEVVRKIGRTGEIVGDATQAQRVHQESFGD